MSRIPTEEGLMVTYFKWAIAFVIVFATAALTWVGKIDPNIWIGSVLPLASVLIYNKVKK